ncbi:hypothetical protein Btru_020950 [Bulinus truncatus]|nr:hypothetical protein Btru_020950 [Bulinus truncatus]
MTECKGQRLNCLILPVRRRPLSLRTVEISRETDTDHWSTGLEPQTSDDWTIVPLAALHAYFDDVGYHFLSGDDFRKFEIAVSVCVFGTISTAAVVSNAVSMYLFLKHGLKDSMSVGLFALSFTDLAVSLLELAASASYMLKDLLTFSLVDLWALAYVYFGWSLYAGYLVSCWITAVISVERCFCVVSPFKVRLIFTRGRCAVVIVFIYVIHVVTLLPVYVVERMQWVPVDPENVCDNCTVIPCFHYTVVFTEFTDEIETAVDITSGLFLFLASQAVLIVSSVWMTYSLKVSSTVRGNKSSPCEALKYDKTNAHQLTTHEKKLVKLVLSLAVLQASCNLPRLVVTVFFYAYPGVNSGDVKNFSTVVWTIPSLFNHISCTSNTLCYYFLNSSYRRMFRETFGLGSN